ncbi:MAG: PKD domain-containing protein [Methylococcales bacterium]|nr:PKD domain-containing protein [Methylococcales bacterium]
MENKYVYILILCLAVFVAAFLNAPSVYAGSEHNVSGWAWSETIGWLSFNNTSGGGATNYGVNVDSGSGALSGFAWSEHIGWIKFNPAGPYPAAPQEPAKLNFGNNQITGWARACSGTVAGDCASASRVDGWDGWIKMSGANYGVSRNGCDLEGYAWGSDVVGWIKFRGTAQDNSSYGVILSGSPTASNLQATQADYCVFGPNVILSWDFASNCGSQTAYQAQIDNNSNFSSPEVDSGQVSSSSNSYSNTNLSYNTTYYWGLKVWTGSASSGWINGPSFTTPIHAYPIINFNWSPRRPAVNENTSFVDMTTISGGAGIASRLWSFQDGNPSASNQQNPIVKFSSIGQKTVMLIVSDTDGFTCSLQKTVSVTLPLAGWREITPK